MLLTIIELKYKSDEHVDKNVPDCDIANYERDEDIKLGAKWLDCHLALEIKKLVTVAAMQFQCRAYSQLSEIAKNLAFGW